MPAERGDSRAPRTAGHRIRRPLPMERHTPDRTSDTTNRSPPHPPRTIRTRQHFSPARTSPMIPKHGPTPARSNALQIPSAGFPIRPPLSLSPTGTGQQQKGERNDKRKRRDGKDKRKYGHNPMETEKRERERLSQKQIQPCRNGLRQGCNPSESPGSGQSDRPETERV